MEKIYITVFFNLGPILIIVAIVIMGHADLHSVIEIWETRATKTMHIGASSVGFLKLSM